MSAWGQKRIGDAEAMSTIPIVDIGPRGGAAMSASGPRPQFERGNAERDVNRNRTFQRDGLQGKRAPRTPDQDVCADAKAEADVPAGAYIFASERSGRYANRGRQHGPAEHTARRDADVEPNHVERTVIGLRRETFAMQTVRFTPNSGHGSCAAG